MLFRSDVEADGRLRVEGPVAPGGALVTGDRGRLTPDGAVVVEGRVDAVLNSGGAKIDPAEVEAALSSHADVALAVVVGVPDARWGQRPVAFVVVRGGATPPDADALRAHCRARLARHKCPDAFFTLSQTEMPRGPTGKVDRRALVDRALAARSGGVDAADGVP